MDNTIKIIITDDKAKYRNLIRRELLCYDITTIAEAENGIELLKHLEHLTPDVILLDLSMPVMDGNLTMTKLSESYPQKRVIVLSSYNNEMLMADYKKRGARGYVIKDEISDDMELFAGIIRKIHRGGLHFNYNEDDLLNATERQKDIIQLSASGHPKKQIGKKLGVTEDYVGRQEKKIMAKMGLTNIAAFLTHLGRTGLEFLRRPRGKNP